MKAAPQVVAYDTQNTTLGKGMGRDPGHKVIRSSEQLSGWLHRHAELRRLTFPAPAGDRRIHTHIAGDSGAMARDEREMVGWVELSPQEPVVAGSVGSFRLVYHVGEYGIDDGGTVKISVRFASDWGKPQFDDPQGPNYTTVSTDGPGQLRARFDPKGFIRPWQKCLVVDNAEWALSKGDTISVVYGDRSQGSPGTVAQTFRETTFEFRVAVDAFGTGQFIVLQDQPELEIVPAAAAKLILIGPTRVSVDEPFAVGVKVEDAWGNPAVGHDGVARLAIPDGIQGLPEQIDFTGQDGVVRIEGVRCTSIGSYLIAAEAEGLARGEGQNAGKLKGSATKSLTAITAQFLHKVPPTFA